ACCTTSGNVRGRTRTWFDLSPRRPAPPQRNGPADRNSAAHAGGRMTAVNDLWRKGAVELAHAIRAREISSREAVESCVARVAAVNPRINAIVDLMADEALEAADRADDAVKKGAELGALHGVPVTLKINVDIAGRATTNGV